MKRMIHKRILSELSALTMLTANLLPFMSITASADEAAHTINVFDIDIKSGADFYAVYTPDDPSENGASPRSNVYVWQADSPNEGHKFVYNIKFSISGQGATDDAEDDTQTREAVSSEGFIEIRVPAHILKYKEGETASVPPDEIEMPVPDIEMMTYKIVEGKKVYSTDHQFVYKYDSQQDEYVIYNIRPVSAGVVYEFPIAYRMNQNTWLYQDLGASDPCMATVTVQSWDKNNFEKKQEIKQSTKEIPVYIDTYARLTETTKSADSILLTAEEAAAKMGISELDENYRYTIWSVVSNISDVTQKYALELTDTTGSLTGTDADGISHTVPGEVVAVKMGGKITMDHTASLSGLTASGRRTDYVLTRYPYESTDSTEGIETLDHAPKNAVYTANNDVDIILTPEDGQDHSTERTAPASFKYEVKDPKWQPIEEKYTAEKHGLYHNGQRRVENRSNVSSYELRKLLEDTEISSLQYETNVTAHAYGKTIENLNTEITEMIVPESISADRAEIIAGARKYIFSENNANSYTLELYSDTEQTELAETQVIALSGYTAPLHLLDMQKIAAQDIADHYYGQKSLTYIFDDRTLQLTDVSALSDYTKLDENDYQINSLQYTYNVKSVFYESETMEFSADENSNHLSLTDEYNILAFYAYCNGSSKPQLAGKYNIRTGEISEIDETLVRSLTGSEIQFTDAANVTGYQIRTQNKYFYLELKTVPSITLKPSETVKGIVAPIIEGADTELKIILANTANWMVKNDDSVLLDIDRMGVDYIADTVRKSDISKKALGEKTTVKGQDGKFYKSRNDTLTGQYELVWQSKISETADGVEVNGVLQNNIPVAQHSGIFYDLLPSHCDIIEGSVNVYVDAAGDITKETQALSPSAFEVLDRIDNYNGSGKKLMILKINAPCEVSYTVTYVTVHSHEDIQDYGSFALNTVAYQTGNADIGDGYADNGGNYAVSMSNYIKGLDPENYGAKRFIYAEATEDILALFPTSSGIYKKNFNQKRPDLQKIRSCA